MKLVVSNLKNKLHQQEDEDETKNQISCRQKLQPSFSHSTGSKALYYGNVVKPTNLEEWKALFLFIKSTIKRILVGACGETLVTFLMVLSDTGIHLKNSY